MENCGLSINFGDHYLFDRYHYYKLYRLEKNSKILDLRSFSFVMVIKSCINKYPYNSFIVDHNLVIAIIVIISYFDL